MGQVRTMRAQCCADPHVNHCTCISIEEHTSAGEWSRVDGSANTCNPINQIDPPIPLYYIVLYTLIIYNLQDSDIN